MQQMPPLPVRLNVELANNFLPKAVANGVCQMPYMAAPMHSEPRIHAPIHSCSYDTASMSIAILQGRLLMQEASVESADEGMICELPNHVQVCRPCL